VVHVAGPQRVPIIYVLLLDCLLCLLLSKAVGFTHKDMWRGEVNGFSADRSEANGTGGSHRLCMLVGGPLSV
jgi:hypothetical protein